METYPFIGQGVKTGNKKLSSNLEVIDEAITEHKQISFDILSVNSQGEQEISDRPKEVCTPIRYFVKDRNYYLVAAKTVARRISIQSQNPQKQRSKIIFLLYLFLMLLTAEVRVTCLRK